MTNIIYEKQTNNWEQKQAYKKYERTKGTYRSMSKKKAARYGIYVKDPIAKYGVKQYHERCEEHDNGYAA